MNPNVFHTLVPLASLFGALGLVSACASSEKDSAATGGAAGEGAGGSGAASGGDAGTGAGGSSNSGGTAGSGGSGGTAGSNCPPIDPPPIPVIWTRDGGAGAGSGAGGEGGASGESGPTSALCFPDIVCFTPGVATPGLSFVQSAHAALASSPSGAPLPRYPNASGEPTVTVTYPEPGKVCISGDDGADLTLDFLNPRWDGMTLTEPPSSVAVFSFGAHGITAMSFNLETPPSTGVAVVFLGVTACDELVFSGAEHEGNSVAIVDEQTTTLSFATDFGPAYDPDRVERLILSVGPGSYDYCLTNLKFLDENGSEVTP